MKDPSSKTQPIYKKRDTTHMVSYGEVSRKPQMGCME